MNGLMVLGHLDMISATLRSTMSALRIVRVSGLDGANARTGDRLISLRDSKDGHGSDWQSPRRC
jgi:hypothetical protein